MYTLFNFLIQIVVPAWCGVVRFAVLVCANWNSEHYEWPVANENQPNDTWKYDMDTFVHKTIKVAFNVKFII